MLAKIKQFFNEQLLPEQHQKTPEAAMQLAAAALLIELSRADFDRSESEQQAMEAVLKEKFALADEQLKTLIELAEAENREASSLYDFTSLVNQHYNFEQKIALVKAMWVVALADGDIYKYEDHLIRKTADLIYLPHSEFIKAKLAVTAENGTLG